jgi:hypothetical protein
VVSVLLPVSSFQRLASNLELVAGSWKLICLDALLPSL